MIIETDFSQSGAQEQLKIKLILINSLYIEPLFEILACTQSINIKHEYLDEDLQCLEFEGHMSTEELDQAAYKLNIIQFLEDLGIYHTRWSNDYLGIIQLVIIYCIVFTIDNNRPQSMLNLFNETESSPLSLDSKIS